MVRGAPGRGRIPLKGRNSGRIVCSSIVSCACCLPTLRCVTAPHSGGELKPSAAAQPSAATAAGRLSSAAVAAQRRRGSAQSRLAPRRSRRAVVRWSPLFCQRGERTAALLWALCQLLSASALVAGRVQVQDARGCTAGSIGASWRRAQTAELCTHAGVHMRHSPGHSLFIAGGTKRCLCVAQERPAEQFFADVTPPAHPVFLRLGARAAATFDVIHSPQLTPCKLH